MTDDPKLKAATLFPAQFHINEVNPGPPIAGHPGSHVIVHPIPPVVVPELGPLSAFSGNWHGRGFNCIFRPNSVKTPTMLPLGPAVGDNVLELNLTEETLSFSASLGSVPNRAATGSAQGDVFLNGVPYLQTINDITDPKNPTGIHLEPGLWIIVPQTSSPNEPVTVARMASIPHGTTINAQGTFVTAPGGPVFPKVDITPTNSAGGTIPFASQKVANPATARIPQDLSSFVAAGTITQAMLDDPNSILAATVAHQTIIDTTTISIDTKFPIGGGTDNIAFLQPNANAFRMTATFYIETVEHRIAIPHHLPGQPLRLQPTALPNQPVPTFEVIPPPSIPVGHVFTVRSKQIQYTQTVFLEFSTLSWPHVSVATLVPSGVIPLPWPP